MKKLNFDIPDELMSKIDEVKLKLFVSKNDIGRLALQEYCNKVLRGEQV